MDRPGAGRRPCKLGSSTWVAGPCTEPPQSFVGSQIKLKPPASCVKIIQDSSGRSYYYNAQTGDSQWDKPKGMSELGGPTTML